MGYKYFDPNEPLEESIEIAKLSGDNNIPEINNIEDYVNFSKDSKFLARSNGINSVRLKVYDPRDLEVVSNSPEIIHAQAFKEFLIKHLLQIVYKFFPPILGTKT